MIDAATAAQATAQAILAANIEPYIPEVEKLIHESIDRGYPCVSLSTIRHHDKPRHGIPVAVEMNLCRYFQEKHGYLWVVDTDTGDNAISWAHLMPFRRVTETFEFGGEGSGV